MRFFRQHKFQILKGIYYFSVFFLASGFSYVAFADPPGSAYAPGATLDPSCAPGTANCTVSTSATASGSDGYLQFNTSGSLASDSGIFWDNTNKRLGVGTSTPSAPLTVVGQVLAGYFTGTTTATSTFGGNLAISGTGTSTSNGGFDITAGCYAINGACIGASVSTNSAGGTGAIQFASGTSFAADATNLFWNDTTNLFGIGTSTPSSSLTVVGQGGVNPFTVASSTGTSLFSLLQNGNVGIGTSTPSFTLDVNGDANIAAGSAYRYNGVSIARASTTLDNYFFGTAGNLTMTGVANFAAGRSALVSNTTGDSSTAIGANSMLFNTTGSHNIAIGRETLYSNASGNQNTAVGNYSLHENTTGSYNAAVGINSLYNNTTGSGNVALGYHSLQTSTSTNYNTAVGYESLNANTSGTENTALGYRSLYANTTGILNAAMGYQSLGANTTGFNNTAQGYRSLGSNTTGAGNTAVGSTALSTNTTGSDNTVIGLQAMLFNTSGGSNTAVGRSALSANTDGFGNTATGYSSLSVNTSGIFNVANGSNALRYNTLGNYNTAIGTNALNVNTTGIENTAVGHEAGYGSLEDHRSVIDTYATFLGYRASRDASVASTTVLTNIIAIGKNAKVGASNSMVLGGTGADAVNVGIGTSTPSSSLTVVGRGGVNPIVVASSTGSALLSILQNGNVGVGTSTPGSLLTVAGGAFDLTATNTEAVIGSELITAASDRNFSSANNWSGTNWSVSGGYGVHTAGNDAYTLSNTYLTSAPVAGNYYQIMFDITTTATGTPGLSVSFGGATAIPVYGVYIDDDFTWSTVVVKAVSNGDLTFTPNNTTWTGFIDDVTVKQITPSSFAQALRNADGTVGIEMRAGGTSKYNTYIGQDSGMNNTVGVKNVANGYQALMSNTSGNHNTANGAYALTSNLSGTANTANGYKALMYNTASVGNTAGGYYSLMNNITGSNNTAYGNDSMTLNIKGNENVSVGTRALYANTIGSGNLALGYHAGYGEELINNHRSVIDTYSGFIGYQATRDQLVASTTALNNAWAIGYNAKVGTSSSMVLGGTGVDAVMVGIGTTTPVHTLNVEQTTAGVVARFTNSSGYCDIDPTNTALVCTSDASLKKNVTTVGGALNAITSLRGVNFKWLNEDDSKHTHLGVIAQEVEQILPELVATDAATGKKSVNYIGFVPVLIEAVKDLASRVSNLEARIAQGVSDGISNISDFVVSTLTAKKVVTETLEMKDSATGETYCVKIANGEWDKTKGACASVLVNTQTASVIESIITPPESASSTPVQDEAATSTPEVIEDVSSGNQEEQVPVEEVTIDPEPTPVDESPAEPQP